MIKNYWNLFSKVCLNLLKVPLILIQSGSDVLNKKRKRKPQLRKYVKINTSYLNLEVRVSGSPNQKSIGMPSKSLFSV